ncbi:MAG: hypothetical protein J6B61_00565 [Romboutsia sp.]|nr:hypothetical protein [Romboutsia sp.]
MNQIKPNEENKINMADLDKLINEYTLNSASEKDLGLIKRYLERLILIIERSRIRDYMMLTDSKTRLFLINFVAGLGKGFGQAIGFTLLAGIVFFILASWVDLPIIGKYIANLINIVEVYRRD